jgi:helicase
MNITDLVRGGADADLVALWSGLGTRLLPVQAKAFKNGVLEGKSVVVVAATSGGKTFVGEAAAIQAARRRGRALYLVPLKALADEKYREFRGRYQPLADDIVVSTQDRAEFDDRLVRGAFRVAIATYEKVAALAARRPELLDTVTLVVVDELQMLGDRERGAALDLLLTASIAASKPQVVGLSAVLSEVTPLVDWLGARAVVEAARPVELRKGILRDGVFRYVGHNSGKPGEERFFNYSPEGGSEAAGGLMLAAAEHLAVKARDQVLAVLPTKHECEAMAAAFARTAKLASAEGALSALKTAEDSEMRDRLAVALQSGAAFHHADLPLEYRELVEAHVRSGAIRVVFATSTLAMGVNLPFDDVLLFPQKWVPAGGSRWTMQDLTRMEFENIAGRAGRFGFSKRFGRAILIEPSLFHEKGLRDAFISAPFGGVELRLADEPLEETALRAFAMMKEPAIDGLVVFLLRTFAGRRVWSQDRARFTERVAQALGVLEARGLLHGGLTPVGRAAAASGILSRTAAAIAAWCERRTSFEVVPLLLELLRTPDGEEIHVPMARGEWVEGRYGALLRASVSPRSHDDAAVKDVLSRISAWEASSAAKKALMLAEWAEGKPMRGIETGFFVGGGLIQRVAADVARLVDATGAIARAKDWPKERVADLARLSAALRGRTQEAKSEPIPEPSAPTAPAVVLRIGLEGTKPVVVARGVTHFLSEREAEVLLIFAMAHQTGDGWVRLKQVDDDAGTARRAVSRLRARLALWSGRAPERVLENDYRRTYRLAFAKREVAVDVAGLRRHAAGLVSDVERAVSGTRS